MSGIRLSSVLQKGSGKRYDNTLSIQGTPASDAKLAVQTSSAGKPGQSTAVSKHMMPNTCKSGQAKPNRPKIQNQATKVAVDVPEHSPSSVVAEKQKLLLQVRSFSQ